MGSRRHILLASFYWLRATEVCQQSSKVFPSMDSGRDQLVFIADGDSEVLCEMPSEGAVEE